MNSSIDKSHLDYWIIKLDTAGALKWEKSLGGTRNDEAFSIEQTKDEGYIIAGYSQSSDGDIIGTRRGSGDYWVVKLFPYVTNNNWIGNTRNPISVAWEDPGNWSLGTLPNASSNIRISGVTVEVSTIVTIKRLDLLNGARYTIITGGQVIVTH